MVTANFDVDEARRAWRKGQEEEEYAERHRQELLERFPDQFVAIRRGEVIANSPDLPTLMLHLQDKGLSPRDVWVMYVNSKPEELLL